MIIIIWLINKNTGNDGHKSEYNFKYLKNQAFETQFRKKEFLNPVLWNKEIFENKINCLEKIDFYKYLNDKMWIKKAFEAIIKHGAVLIENVIHFKLYFF
jgi:hypothetical protein